MPSNPVLSHESSLPFSFHLESIYDRLTCQKGGEKGGLSTILKKAA